MEIQQRKRVAITSSFFPVDESLLPQLNISPAQHEELRRYALQAALDTVRDGPTWGRSNIERAVSSGWKVLSARPTACFLTKRQSKQKKQKQRKGSKRAAAQAQTPSEQQPDEDDKRTAPPTPRVTIPGVTSLGSFHGADIVRGQMGFQPFAPMPLEAASGQHFMAHAVLPNSLEDVMNTLYCEHTREMRALKRKVYGEAALDCCVLQTLEGASLEDPFWYLGLKWLALRSPMQALMASREFVYLEHLGTHVDPETGRRMLYRVTQSVHIRGYGGQDSYFGLTRGHIEAAFVYWMDDENEARNPLLHVCAKGRIHMKGSMPDTLMYRYLKAFWRSERSLFPANRSSGSSIGLAVNDAGDQAPPNKSSKKKKKKKKARRRRVPGGPPLEMAHEWVADELRPRCSVCNKKFRLVKRFKHHCRACGEVICRDCTFHHRVNVRATQSFRGLRGTVAASVDLVSDAKRAKDEPPPATNFDETMTCSFDNQVEEEELESGGEFDASLSLVNARRAVNGPMETAVLGGDSVVCVVMAKVCLRCLHSVPLVNRPKSKSTQRRRHSEMALNGELPAAITEGDGEFGLDENYPLRPQTWTADDREVEELDGIDDELSQTAGGEQDLPMLVVDDEDAESVDGLGAEMKRRPGSNAFDVRPGSSMYVRPGSYAQEWTGQEDGGLDSHANHERVMILSPHALSTSSSVTSSQMKEFMDKDESSYDSSDRSQHYRSQHSIESPSDTDNDDNDSIQFYPTQTNRVLDEESKPAAEGSQGRMSSGTAGFDPTSLFELKDEEKELAASAAAATAAVSATERVLRRMRDLQDEALYQNRQVPSPSSSTTSLWSEDEGECSEIDEPMQDLRQALAQVESSLADQARMLFTIEQERKKETASAAVATPNALSEHHSY
ncbi:hypothetical protein PHYPSEUDO_013609 [Phytophthora pseudosyringae]|uniref:FYVE-type domain-containing protein n=1 Tax=Phytophthora pseudosyringae TaxID=221518 RepID=A0A8T1W5B2_9STRA|nr:hypothetical protein PHYPSEUDO_013609 [Phytophthora pseudosyringae]